MMESDEYLEGLIGIRSQALRLLRSLNELLTPSAEANQWQPSSQHWYNAVISASALLTFVLLVEIEHVKQQQDEELL